MTDDAFPVGSRNEIVWTAKRLWVLARCWSVPVGETALKEFPPADRDAARALALLLIVVLSFAVRSIDDVTSVPGHASATTVTLLAGACAGGLSWVIDLLSRAISQKMREYTVISGYAATLLIMLLYVFFDQVFHDSFVWYHMLADTLGRPLAAVLLAAPTCAVVWTGKVLLLDRRRISGFDGARSGSVIVGSALVVYAVAELPQGVFNWVISWGAHSG